MPKGTLCVYDCNTGNMVVAENLKRAMQVTVVLGQFDELLKSISDLPDFVISDRSG